MCGNFGVILFNDSESKSDYQSDYVVGSTYDHRKLVDPLSIMEAQTSATEVRGKRISYFIR